MPGDKNKNPREPNRIQEEDIANAALEGRRFLGQFDLTALDPDRALSKRGRKDLLAAREEAGTDADQPLTLQELKALGIEDFGQLSSEFRRELAGENLFKRESGLAAEAQIKAFVSPAEGFEEAKAARDHVKEAALRIKTGGVDVAEQGLALVAGKLDDPLARAVMSNFNEQFGNALAAQGLGGAASTGTQALMGSTAALGAVQAFGARQLGIGLSAAEGGTALHTAQDPFSDPLFALDRADLAFDRKNFDFLLSGTRNAAHRQRVASRVASTTNALIGLGGAVIGGAIAGEENRWNDNKGISSLWA